MSRGVYPPNNRGAIPQLSRLTPLFICHPPQTIFGHCIRNFVQFYALFSELWKLSVRNDDHKKIQMELVKHIAWFHF